MRILVSEENDDSNKIDVEKKLMRNKTRYSCGFSTSCFFALNSVYPHFPQLARSLWSARNTPSPHFGQLFRCRTIFSPSTLNTSLFSIFYSFFGSVDGAFASGFCGFSFGASFLASPSFPASFFGFFFVPRPLRFRIGSASPFFASSMDL